MKALKKSLTAKGEKLAEAEKPVEPPQVVKTVEPVVNRVAAEPEPETPADQAVKESDIVKHSGSIELYGKHYDYMLNCTGGQWGNGRDQHFYFEPCILFLYKAESQHFALTIMEGDFVSLYPYSHNIFSLASVRHTPLGRYDCIHHATARMHFFR